MPIRLAHESLRIFNSEQEHHFYQSMRETINDSGELLEDDLLAWLSEICLLKNVSFHYLVPSENLLPSNSVRFFYVNSNWQRVIMDGACSLGRTASADLHHDEVLLKNAYDNVFKRIQAVRPLLQGKSVANASMSEPVSIMGGFLLRSPLVRGWRGLEFQAYDHSDAVIKALRIETLSDEVLIGLFAGVPYKLEIAQPPEGFFFGFNHINDKFYKRLRSFEDGSLLSETDTVEVVLKNKNARTIDVAATAKNMETFFSKPFTSAEFALQMIKTPYLGKVIRKDAK
ncbi:hypothetical protein [Desulfosporosinus youngiae]|uniref:Uncharacterized protein n=1 Tax=Desulfosporosinus youngiae DSM 17734 TaxID=768710 RepID=H5XVF1_9FIRM|nr:hypothetical protein [Desulfosporosinus youngiae]EHQ89887.1 hypothetical protein DesyoDRAFT_2839 [Desulfosporosinus youngiae DSM 17734]